LGHGQFWWDDTGWREQTRISLDALMAREQVNHLLECLRALAGRPPDGTLTDNELLARFARRRDESAFAQIVRRHGPMVLRVCRRVLGSAHDAEDAFQATFLVLAGKAGSVRWQASAANWLHKVAYHVALRARAAAARRRVHEARPEGRAGVDPLEELTARELLGVLDEELTRLPGRYRAPLVVCYLEGATRDEAARQLGCTLGTLKRRLERGRELLRRRLARRGLSLAVPLASAELLAGTAPAAVAPTLLEATARAAVAFTTQTGGTVALAPRVVALARQVLPVAGAGSGKTILGLVLLLAGLLAVGVTLGIQGRRDTEAGRVSNNRSDFPRVQPVRVDPFDDRLPAGAIARIGQVFRGAPRVGRMACSPDGKIRASWWLEGLLEIECKEERTRHYRLPGVRLLDLAIFPNGKSLAVLESRDCSIHLWDFLSKVGPPEMLDRGTGRGQLSPQREKAFACFSVSPNGRLLAGGRTSPGKRGGIELWRISPGQRFTELRRPIRFGSPEFKANWLAFSANSTVLAAAAPGGSFRLWETATGNELGRFREPAATPEKGFGRSCGVAPNGRMFAIALPDGTIRIWHKRAGKEAVRVKGHAAEILTVAFSDDSKTVFSAGRDGKIRYWDVETGEQKQASRGFASVAEAQGYQGMVFYADGRGYMRADKMGGVGGPGGGHGHPGGVHCLAYSSDGRMLATKIVGERVCLADATTGREIMRLGEPSRDIKELAFAPNGRTMATGGWDGMVRVWDIQTGREIHCMKGHTDTVCTVAFAPDGRTLASGSWDCRVLLWDLVKGGRPRQMPRRPGLCIANVSYSPDGKLLAVAIAGNGSMDPKNVVYLWDTAGTEVRQLPHWAQPVAFSPDSRLLALIDFVRPYNPVSDQWTVCVWDLTAGQNSKHLQNKPIRILRSESGDVFWRIAFSHDTRSFFALQQNNVLQYELASGRIRSRWRGTQERMAVSPCGKSLAVGYPDNTTLIYDLRNGKQVPSGRTVLPPHERRRLWTTAAGKDPGPAFRDLARLAQDPGAIDFLRQNLRPVPTLQPDRLADLLADLGSDKYAVRERATAHLEMYREAADGALRKALKDNPSAEVRNRIRQVLERTEPSPDSLRALRAIEILEEFASPEALRFLKELAAGEPGARLTQEARASLARLAKDP
jgi:RNA polymerase sigma factor (sigma-70 family)